MNKMATLSIHTYPWIGQHGPFVLFCKMASSHMSLLGPILTCPLGSKTKSVMGWMVLVPSTNHLWTRWQLYPSIHTYHMVHFLPRFDCRFVLFWKMASSHMSLLGPILTCPLGSKTKSVMCWMVLVPSTNQLWTRWRLYPSIHTTWSISSPLEYKTKLVMCWRVLVPSTFHKWTRWQLYSSIHTHGLANTVQSFYCRYPYVITETHSYRSIGFQNKIS